MHRYKQYCPVARATEILGDRWTLLIVRELIAGSRRFNEIERGLPGISRSVLASRLRDLERSGIVDHLPESGSSAGQYQLSEAGLDVRNVIEALGAWGVRWAFGEPRPEELDPALLVWKLHQRVDRERLPAGRTVVEFDFSGRRTARVWLVLEPSEVSVCVTPPRFETDLVVHADLDSFYKVWFGQIEFSAAIRCGGIRIEGRPALARQFPQWLLWSPMRRFAERSRSQSPG